MWRSLLSISALIGLTACSGGNPFAPDSGTTNSAITVNGSEFDEFITGDSVVYNDNGTADPSDDTLLVNNIAFDNSDLSGGSYTFQRTLPSGFGLYESPLLGLANERKFYAVFKRSTHAQAAAIGTDDYIGFGFGGLSAERLGEGNIPAARANQYVFTGQYAGIRVYRSSDANGFKTVGGTAQLEVDVLDFDGTGAVEGVINNRTVYNLDGTVFVDPNDFISLATATINTENATINQSTAVAVPRSDRDNTIDGNWSGVFAGPNGEEIAGIVLIEGAATPEEQALITTLGFDGPSTEVRENGVFIAQNGG